MASKNPQEIGEANGMLNPSTGTTQFTKTAPRARHLFTLGPRGRAMH